KLWSAVPGRHASSPGSSTTADHDVPATRSRWSSLVIRDPHSESFLETTVSERQACLCNCRYPNRRGIHVQPGLAGATASLEIQQNLQKMEELQYRMYAENKHSLLIVLQGLDAAGKDGVVRHVLTGLNPSGCVSTNFKEPTKEELAHDFLWRVHPHVPAKGSIAIFNRSHYEDVLVVRV